MKKSLLKKSLMVLVSMSTVFVVLSAKAEGDLIGNCWIESGADLEDGQFAVNLETKSISKGKLVSVLGALSGVNIEPIGYPLIFGDQMFVYVRAVDFSVPPLDRVTFKTKVRAELEAIVNASAGISASCNYRGYPPPAVGVRN